MKLYLANSITLFRVALFVLFVWFISVGQIPQAAIFFMLAWGLDAVDGWVARKRGEASPFGSLLDKVVDRTLFAATGVLLLGLGVVPSMALWLLTKDIALIPALTISWKKKKEFSGAGKLGRLTSVLQGVGFIWLMGGVPYPWLIVVPTGLLGALTAFWYMKALVRK